MKAKLLLCLTACAVNAAFGAELTIDLNKPGAAVSPTLYGAFFEDINRAGDGGLSWEDSESPLRANLYAIVILGRNSAMAVGELGTVIVTEDGGRTWLNQPNITGKVLQTIAFQGGTDLWVGGRGGTILKRIAPLAPNSLGGPKVPPTLRPAIKTKPKPRRPLITVTDDGDIPIATPPKKDQ